MRRRKISKHIYLSEIEAEQLRQKAEMSCLTESTLIRMLIKGFHPKAAPDKNFYKFIDELKALGNNLNQLTAKANKLGFIDVQLLLKEVKEWRLFRAEIEREILMPEQDSEDSDGSN